MNAKLTGRAAQIMEQFNSSAAKLNNGTIVIGGRVEAPTARKLVRLGLIERAGDLGIIYRATEAGRAYLTSLEQIATDDQVRCGDLKLENERGWAVRYDVNYTGNGHATFAVIRAINPIPGTLPTLEVQFRGTAGTVQRFAHSLFDGWRWVAA